MKVLACALLAALSFSAQVNATTIWTNPITGTNPSSANPYTAGQTVVANLSVSGIGRGSGITGGSGANQYKATSWDTSSSPGSTKYFTFTLAPNLGFAIDFTSFGYTGVANSNGPTMFDFRSSLDGFAANIGSPNETGTTISLSASQFQGVTTPIEFRFYGFGAKKASGTFAIKDFTFVGTVVTAPTVPESFPTFAGLLCVFGALILSRRLMFARPALAPKPGH